MDAGSNAIRFVVAEVTGPGRLEAVDSTRVPLRLGTDVFRSGELSAGTMDAAVAALREIRRRMDELGIVHYRAVATSATRDSANGEELVRRAHAEAGIRLETLSGEEEARLIARAAREGGLDGSWLLVDVGGGSVEVTRLDGDEVAWVESKPIGAVRLLAGLSGAPDVEESVRGSAAELVSAVRGRMEGAKPTEGLLATGGSIDAIVTMMEGPAAAGEARTVTLATLREAITRLGELSVEQRQEELGLDPDRADVILPAALLYAEAADAVGVEELRVPAVGLKDGVLLDLADRLAAAERKETRIAFVSDVHGNLLALREAIRLAEEAGAGRVVMAGDSVGDGPLPVEVIRMLREHRIETIRGNVDRKVVRMSRKKRKKLEKWLEEKSRDVQNRAWTARQLKDAKEERSWLDERPEQLLIEAGKREVLVVHGSPRGDTDYILPSLTPVSLALKLEPLGDSERPAVLVSGHSHIPFVKEVDGVLVVNCGSCGRPKDGDWRASMAVLDLDGEPRAEIVRFEYPLEALLEELSTRQVPGVTPRSYRIGVK